MLDQDNYLNVNVNIHITCLLDSVLITNYREKLGHRFEVSSLLVCRLLLQISCVVKEERISEGDVRGGILPLSYKQVWCVFFFEMVIFPFLLQLFLFPSVRGGPCVED